MWNVCSLTESFLARPQIIVYKAYNDILLVLSSLTSDLSWRTDKGMIKPKTEKIKGNGFLARLYYLDST